MFDTQSVSKLKFLDLKRFIKTSFDNQAQFTVLSFSRNFWRILSRKFDKYDLFFNRTLFVLWILCETEKDWLMMTNNIFLLLFNIEREYRSEGWAWNRTFFSLGLARPTDFCPDLDCPATLSPGTVGHFWPS